MVCSPMGVGLKAKPGHLAEYICAADSAVVVQNTLLECVVLDTLVVYPPTHLVRRIIPNYWGRGASLVPCCNTIRGCWGGLRMRVRWGWGSKQNLGNIYVLLWSSRTRYRSSAKLNWNYGCVLGDTFGCTQQYNNIIIVYTREGESWDGLLTRIQWGWGS